MATWDNIEKAGVGGGWTYNELDMAYNQENDADTGLAVLYNALGTTASFSNISKS